MVFNNVIVELSEDLFVVIHKLQELSRDGAEIIFTNCESGGNLQQIIVLILIYND